MRFMSVTRDVLKFTGWLKAAAYCRVGSRGCDAGRGVPGEAGELGRVGQWRAQVAWTRRTRDWGAGGEGTRGGAHVEHAAHPRDAGRVEAHRLVEGPRGLPSRKQGMRYRARCGTGDIRKAWG